MLVNNLQLPAVLVKAIKEGRWTRASPAHYLREIVPSTPIAWCFYSVEQMSRETEVLRRYAPISEFTTLGECRTDDRRPEGQDDLPSRVASVTLDISRAVCIADAGHDCPICLDYATNPSIPSVRGLNVVSPGNGWQPIAADIDSFLEMLERIGH